MKGCIPKLKYAEQCFLRDKLHKKVIEAFDNELYNLRNR